MNPELLFLTVYLLGFTITLIIQISYNRTLKLEHRYKVLPMEMVIWISMLSWLGMIFAIIILFFSTYPITTIHYTLKNFIEGR